MVQGGVGERGTNYCPRCIQL
ncbi:hypothetical protein HHL17_01475 [Chitinophaga sp. G-6-1-13]|uniref:Zinc finger FPG/IleRS-type domain-containing protein n=1 Tax=Chitinophaga fulva TaxID=2728842 RepID=A0A848GBI1_9BACT|nr:hypothetical protein [Chitinophaga fulva]